jgi:hypothetical protein
MSKESKAEKRIKQRYFRKVMAYPEGAIVHHGDCMFFSEKKICTCGLHHDLSPLNEEITQRLYPDFFKEWSL